MVKHIHTFLFIGIIAISCNNNYPAGSETTTSKDTALTTTPPVAAPVIDTAIIGCYNWIKGRDTAILQLEVKGGNITGSLEYDFYEKDRNDGTVQAELNNGLIIGWYLFRSEGVMSVRQVAWKTASQKLYPATGEMIQRNDTLMFKNIDRLNIDSSNAFRKVPCII